jgi:probable F420-dependent oxidoreductase
VTERPHIDFPSRIGVWWGAMSFPIHVAQEVAREIESLGYGSLFIPEVGLKDCLVESAALLDATDKLVIGTGIANIHARIPTAAEAGGRTLTVLHPGRFVLGLGVSHGPLVENMLGMTYEKPLATMRTYLERMAALPDFIEAGAGRPVRLLAALGPKMIELSGTMADGARPVPRGVLGSAELPELVAASGIRRIRLGQGWVGPAGPRLGDGDPGWDPRPALRELAAALGL